MINLVLILRIFFPGLYRTLQRQVIGSYILREALKDRSTLGIDVGDIINNPDWEFVENGDDVEGDRTNSDNSAQCECGTKWSVNSNSAFFNIRPQQNDINALYDTIKYPNNPQQCDAPCLPVEKFRGMWWSLWKNKKTGQFWLYCGKRVQWHCERPA